MAFPPPCETLMVIKSRSLAISVRARPSGAKWRTTPPVWTTKPPRAGRTSAGSHQYRPRAR